MASARIVENTGKVGASRRSSGAARSASSSVVRRRRVRKANWPATAPGSVRCSPWESAQAGTSSRSCTRRYPAARSSRKSAWDGPASSGRSDARWVRLRTSVSRSRNSASCSGSRRASAPDEAGERLVVLAGVATRQRVRGPGEQRPQQQGELVRRERRVEQADGELGEQAEQLGAPRRALEVRPVAQQRGLQAVDEQGRVAEGVEVLAHGLRERGTHAVQAVDRLQQRQVAVGDDHLLRGVREVGAQGF